MNCFMGGSHVNRNPDGRSALPPFTDVDDVVTADVDFLDLDLVCFGFEDIFTASTTFKQVKRLYLISGQDGCCRIFPPD